MPNVDERVVELKLYNQQFENGIRTSVESLKNLKSGLDLDGATRSLSKLDRVGKSFSLAGIAENIELISDRFSNLGIIGDTALTNLADSAVNSGKRIIMALTIDPIKMGLTEYETKMGAIQTILTNTASKGSSLEDINEALNELNEYSDKTIYNFAEMAKNIGTFTAAGVGLKESAIAIKGIANLAAGSGSTSEQASTAMYQLSQALAAGKVSLMDWNSVVNAGMGGELFQKALEKTAKELGNGRNMAVSFRDSLQDGWITTAVLTKTLAKFADDESLVKAATQVKTFTQLLDTMKESVQSGWAQTWENIIGDKGQSAEMLTKLNNAFGEIIGPATEARNEMLKFWNQNGGRDALIEGVTNALKGLGGILKPIGEAFREIFPAITGERLIEITKRFRDLTTNFKIGAETNVNLRRSFQGLFAILDIGKQALFATANGLASIIKYISPASSGLLSFTGNIGDFFVRLNTVIKSSDSFNSAIEKIGKILKPIADSIKISTGGIAAMFGAIGSMDTSGLDSFSEKLKSRFEPLTKLGDLADRAFSGILEGIKNVAPTFYKLASIIGGALDRIRNSILNAFNTADFNAIFDTLNTGLFTVILAGISKFIFNLGGVVSSGGGIFSGITGVLDGVKASLSSYQSSLKAGVLLKIAFAIGILAVSLIAIASIDSVKLTVSLAALTTMFVELFGAMTLFERFSGGLGFLTMTKTTIAMIGLSTAVLILSVALTRLAKLDWNSLSVGLTGVIGIAGVLLLSAKLLDTSSGSLIRASLGFILLGAAIRILVSAVERLSVINQDKLTKGLIGIGILMTELALFMKASNLSGMGVIRSVGILIFAAAINVLAIAVKSFGDIDRNALIKGLTSMGIVIAEVTIFANATRNVKNVFSTAIALTVLGAAMLIFGKAISNMGDMSWEEIARGLTVLGSALAMIAITFIALPKNIFIQSLAFMDMASAILMLSKALGIMSKMSWPEVQRSLVALGGSMAIIVSSFALMKNKMLDATALMILVGAIMGLAVALKMLGAMSLVEIGVSLLAMAGAFGIIGLAGLLLAPLTPAIMALALAIGLLGAGCLAAGLGVSLLAAGLAALAVSGAAGAVALVAILSSIVGLIPALLKALAQGVIDFVKVIGEGAPIVADAFIAIALSIVAALTTVIPMVVEALVKLLTTVLKVLADNIPQMIEAGMKLILGFLKGIKDHIKEITETAIDVILQFISGIMSKISEIVDAAFKVIIGFINGLAEAIKNNHDALYSAVGNLITAIVVAIIDLMPKIIEVGGDIIRGFVKGFAKMATVLVDAAVGIVGDAVQGVKDFLGIHSPSKVFAEIGQYSAEGLAKGIKQNTPKAVKESKAMAKAVADASKAEFDKSVKWIDDKKYYKQLSLSEELTAWENLQKKYVEGTEERDKADREAYRVKQELIEKQRTAEEEYYTKSKEISEKLKQDIQSVNDEYNQALASRSDTLYRTYGLFDEIRDEDSASGTELINNLETQVAAFDEWQKNITELAKKGISDGLLKELQDMGPTALGKIKALNQLIKPELDKYANLWEEKHDQAKEAAVNELEGMRIESDNKITDLNNQSDVSLIELRDVYQTRLSEITANTQVQLEDFNSKWETKTQELNTQTNKDFGKIVTDIQNTFKEPDWAGVGKNIIDGIINGVRNQAIMLSNATADAAKQALNAAKETLGIQSPSKEFAEIGKYSMVGFAGGLRQFANLAVKEVGNVGIIAKESLRDAVSNIVNIVSGNLELVPTIRPVLDLTNVVKGLRSTFAKSQVINVDGIRSKTESISSMDTNRRIGSDLSVNKPSVKSVSGGYQGGGLAVTITNFVNNRTQDVQAFAEELEFYRNQIVTGRGGN